MYQNNHNEVEAFIQFLTVSDTSNNTKEISLMYNKQNDIKSGLFLLEEVYHQLLNGYRIVGTIWEHNTQMNRLLKKVGDVIEYGYCWTIKDDSITNKQYQSSAFTLSYKDYILYYNGIYFSVDLISYHYNVNDLKAFMKDYGTNTLVVFSPIPNIKMRMYKYTVWDVDIVMVKKYADIYRKLTSR